MCENKIDRTRTQKDNIRQIPIQNNDCIGIFVILSQSCFEII